MKRAAAVALLAATLFAGCGEDAPDKVSLYDRAPVPAVPDRTRAIEPQWVADKVPVEELPDGQYWATDTQADAGLAIRFELRQALFAGACTEVLGEDECENDFGVVPDPHLSITVPVAGLVSITVVAASRQNYAVFGPELHALVSGGTRAPEAPPAYQYKPYPFILTVEHGTVVKAQQIWLG